tara:strand:+ start:5207 stop:6040 length:834 start_codon:yes stop_codon:yes gene_type:complete
MKKKVITLILVLGVVIFAKAQSSINDYKYVVVPHFYEFVKGKDAFRLNTITRFLLRKNGLNAFMQEEIKETDYKRNNCLALKADVMNINSMLMTKLKVVLKNCDGDIVFESKIGQSKVKEYGIAYKEALNRAFESFEGINYHYIPNKDIISRADEKNSEDEAAIAKKLVGKLKDELKEKKDKEIIVKTKEDDGRKILPDEIIKDNNTSYLKAIPVNNGFELINIGTNKIEYIIQKTALKEIYIIKNQNGIVYKKEKVWIIEYLVDGKSISKTLEIKF